MSNLNVIVKNLVEENNKAKNINAKPLNILMTKEIATDSNSVLYMHNPNKNIYVIIKLNKETKESVLVELFNSEIQASSHIEYLSK